MSDPVRALIIIILVLLAVAAALLAYREALAYQERVVMVNAAKAVELVADRLEQVAFDSSQEKCPPKDAAAADAYYRSLISAQLAIGRLEDVAGPGNPHLLPLRLRLESDKQALQRKFQKCLEAFAQNQEIERAAAARRAREEKAAQRLKAEESLKRQYSWLRDWMADLESAAAGIKLAENCAIIQLDPSHLRYIEILRRAESLPDARFEEALRQMIRDAIGGASLSIRSRIHRCQQCSP